jgi:hypothetical protein
MVHHHSLIRIKADKSAAESTSKQYHAGEKARVQQSLTDAEIVEKAKTEILKREQRQRIQELVKGTKTTTELVKEAGKEDERNAKLVAEAQRRAAKEAAEVVKQAAKEKAQAERTAWREIDANLKAQQYQTARAAQETIALTRAMLGAGAAGAAMNVAKQVIQAIAQSSADARIHVHGMTEEMERARTALREIAALTGQKATASFTARQAREAAAVGISPEQYAGFQTAFQAYAGQYIGDKLPADQAGELQKVTAGYQASQGLDQAEGAQLMGTLVGKSKKGATTDELLGQYGQVMKVMQLAPGYTGPLLGQVREVIQENVGEGGDFKDSLEAAKLVRVMSERNPAEASTYSRALLRGLREIRMSPDKMQATGIKKGMDVFQQVQAVLDSAKDSGMDESEYLSQYFKDIREFGAVRTGRE